MCACRRVCVRVVHVDSAHVRAGVRERARERVRMPFKPRRGRCAIAEHNRGMQGAISTKHLLGCNVSLTPDEKIYARFLNIVTI